MSSSVGSFKSIEHILLQLKAYFAFRFFLFDEYK